MKQWMTVKTEVFYIQIIIRQSVKMRKNTNLEVLSDTMRLIYKNMKAKPVPKLLILCGASS